MYELVDYARGRLEGSVIAINNNPCMVEHINRDRELHYHNLELNEGGVVSLDSKEISLEPFSLGYINFQQGASYLCRMARRRWKQGLDRNGAIFKGLNFSDRDWIHSENFLKCIKNEYPSFEDAYEMSQEFGHSVAFTKKWAIDCKGRLYYRGKLVGRGRVKLDEAFKYLEDMLKEAV